MRTKLLAALTLTSAVLPVIEAAGQEQFPCPSNHACFYPYPGNQGDPLIEATKALPTVCTILEEPARSIHNFTREKLITYTQAGCAGGGQTEIKPRASYGNLNPPVRAYKRAEQNKTDEKPATGQPPTVRE